MVTDWCKVSRNGKQASGRNKSRHWISIHVSLESASWALSVYLFAYSEKSLLLVYSQRRLLSRPTFHLQLRFANTVSALAS